MSAGSRWLLWEWAHREERQQGGGENWGLTNRMRCAIIE